MRIELTELSLNEYNRLAGNEMTPEEAARYLTEDITIRTFYELLCGLYKGEGLTERLAEGYHSACPDIPADSVRRRIRNWASGKNLPSGRDDIFLISFILGLNEEQASLLLGSVSDYGIHYRDGKELSLAYCLQTGQSYEKAQKLMQSLPPVPVSDPVSDNYLQNAVRTEVIKNDFSDVYTDEEFMRLYTLHLQDFGAFHLKAYDYFNKYFRLLTLPDHGLNMEEDLLDGRYSIEKISSLYFDMNLPSTRSRKGYTLVQKLIRKYWPNATSLKNIQARREPVTRKLLLLLYVITENVTDEEYDELDEEYLTPKERFEEHWWRLNLIMDDCGMNPLDPRNAFDWLILYAVSSAEDSMSSRMESVMAALF